MKKSRALALCLTSIFFSTSALAASAVAVKELPNGGAVTLTGTVEDFDSAHSFILRDETGSIKVDLTSSKDIVLKNGDKVTVSGTVDKGIFETDVTAEAVNEDKGFGEKVGQAIDKMTGQDKSSTAEPVMIGSLPASGLIKVSGVVDSVSSEKKFTLRDGTGTIDVNIKSEQAASLNKGTSVAVIGYVNKGLLSSSINATEVKVTGAMAPVSH